jgi:hypothetical protein
LHVMRKNRFGKEFGRETGDRGPVELLSTAMNFNHYVDVFVRLKLSIFEVKSPLLTEVVWKFMIIYISFLLLPRNNPRIFKV